MAKSVGTQDRVLRKRRMVVAAALLVFAGIVGVLALLFGRDALAFLTDGHRVQQQVERLGPLAPFPASRWSLPRATRSGSGRARSCTLPPAWSAASPSSR